MGSDTTNLGEKVFAGVLLGATAGGLAVLFGNFYSEAKNNKIKFKDIKNTKNINEDAYVAIRLKQLSTMTQAKELENLFKDLVNGFEDLIDLYKKAVQKPLDYYSWKASEYDQNIQTNILLMTKHMMESTDKINERYNHSKNNVDNKSSDSLLNEFTKITQELRQSSLAYLKHINAATKK